MSHEIVLAKKFTEQQSTFVREIIAGGDVKEAAIKAGYSQDFANSSAYALLQQPAILAAVQIGVAKSLALDSPVARKTLRDIMVDETVDKRLRVACAKDLLNRAGFIAPKAVAAGNAGETPLNEMSTTELRALADKLEGELAGRAKDVSSAKPAPHDTQAIDDII